jgi:hypothetical protein
LTAAAVAVLTVVGLREVDLVLLGGVLLGHVVLLDLLVLDDGLVLHRGRLLLLVVKSGSIRLIGLLLLLILGSRHSHILTYS